jgi:hypothetical protein
LFYIKTGNNGATYVICCNTFKSINEGLKFYKPLNLLGKLKKTALFGVLWIIGKLNLKMLKSSGGINAYCANVIGEKIDFNLSEDCSVLISPTRDKVIVNHHKKYFQKFAFGESHFNVKNESEVYRLLNSSDFFLISEISDIQNNEGYCSFKLSHPSTFSKHKKPPEPEILSEILVEFFNTVPLTFISWQDYITGIKSKLKSSTLYDAFIIDIVNKIALNDFKLPLGLVHRDFKPWNILYGNPPLIYDFEEAVLNGPPLEDFYNFYIDPIVRYQTPKNVLDTINSNDVKEALEDYVQNLQFEIPKEHLLVTYLVARLLFWESRKDLDTANHYKKVLKAL